MQKLFDLRFYKVYINDTTMSLLPKIEDESPIDATFLWFASGICMISIFDQVLIKLPKLYFIPSSNLSND